MPHLFVDISSHGFGHLAQTAPIINALARRMPDLRLTVRSGLTHERLSERITSPLNHLPSASDFGLMMHDPMRVDATATAQRYQAAHVDWVNAVHSEADFLSSLAPDFVLSNVSYLPLAGAALAGIPAAACCSLNWYDLFVHFFGKQPWAQTIADDILSAYASAPFLALEPAMAMNDLPQVNRLEPVAAVSLAERAALEQRHPDFRGKK